MRIQFIIATGSVLISTILFFAQSAMADFSGVWEGQGHIRFNGQAQTSSCNPMFIHLIHSQQTFTVVRSEFRCDGMVIKSRVSATYAIRGDELYLGDKLLGTITTDRIHTRLQRGQQQEEYLLLREGDRLIYQDHVDWTTEFSTEVSGELIRDL